MVDQYAISLGDHGVPLSLSVFATATTRFITT